MNIPSLMAQAEIMFRGRAFNWLPSGPRRALRDKVMKDVIDEYFKRYLPAEGAVPDVPVIPDDANEKIFSLWLQGEDNAPPLVKACWRSVRHYCPQTHVVLDDKTLFDYIELPGVIMDKRRRGKIGHANFADIARVELLHNYGGYWLDATGFVSSPISQFITDQDFFVFMAGCINPQTFIQNCFIRARKGAYLLEAWRSMILDFWKVEPKAFDYFMHQFLFRVLVHNDPHAIVRFAEMPQVGQEPTHTLWWSGYGGKPFDAARFDSLTAGAFFQKTSFRDRNATDPVPGSFADEMINRMYK
jgi:hypothetical protein